MSLRVLVFWVLFNFLLCSFFTFDLKTYSIEQCFLDLKRFVEQFKGTLAENAKQRAAEEKSKKAEEMKAAKRSKVAPSLKLDIAGIDMTQAGLMESLINQVKATGGASRLNGRGKRNLEERRQQVRRRSCSRERLIEDN